MGEFLSMDNILTGDEAASLFLDDNVEEVENNDVSNTETTEETEEKTTEVNPDDLFEEEPESVGSEEVKKGKEDTTSKKDGSSPDNNFYASIASALKEEGVFPDLEDEIIDQISNPEDFRNLVDQQIHAGLQQAQKRIYDALQSGVEPETIKHYENTLNYLGSITEEHLNDESEDGENIRRTLLLQDFINRGYSNERANKMVEKIFDSGDDIEEAKQALIANREYYGAKYQRILDEAKALDESNKQRMQQQATQLKNDILNGNKAFGSIDLDKQTRKKVYDNITKPVYRDPETGQYYSALQKYRREHDTDFIKNVGLLFTLTDGFTNIDKLVQPSAKKEVKKKLKELEHTLKNTNRGGGNLKYVGQTPSSQGTFFDNDFTIDLS